jgi:hypothetical protein
MPRTGSNIKQNSADEFPAGVRAVIGHGDSAPHWRLGFLVNGFRCALPTAAYVEFAWSGTVGASTVTRTVMRADIPQAVVGHCHTKTSTHAESETRCAAYQPHAMCRRSATHVGLASDVDAGRRAGS